MLGAFGAFLCLSVGAFASPVDVSVLTWNIHRDVGSNGPNSSSQSYLAKVVNYLNPDVWNINELGGNNTGYSASAEQAALVSFIQSDVTIFGVNPQLGKDFYVYVGTATDHYIGNAIVSRYPLSDQTTYADGLRGLVHADVQLPNGQELGDFTTHFKATTDTSESTSDSEKRQTEAETDAGNIESWKRNNPNTPSVFTGDLNTSEEPGEDDNWADGNVGDTLPNGDTFHPITTIKSAGFNDADPVSANGDKDTIKSGSANPTDRFDYNLYSQTGGITSLGGLVFNTKAYGSGQLPSGFATTDSQNASDHLPVLMRYQVQAVPEPATLAALGLGFLATLRRRKRG